MLGLLLGFVVLFLVTPLAASVGVLWWTRNRLLATLAAPVVFLMLGVTVGSMDGLTLLLDRALSGRTGLDYFLSENFETVSLVVLLLLASGLFSFLPRSLSGSAASASRRARSRAAT